MTNKGLVTITHGATTRPNKYHTDPECNNLPEHSTEIPRDEAESRGMDECSLCSDGPNPNKNQAKSLRNMIKDGEIDV